MCLRQVPFLVLLMILLSYTQQMTAQDDTWKLSKWEEGIMVYTQNVPGTNFKVVRSVTQMNIAAEELLEVVNDYSHIQPWRYKVNEMRLLDGDPMGSHHLYFALNMPIPLSDRDFILRIDTETKTDGLISIHFQAIADYQPERKGKVRMNKMEGFWELKPMGPDTTQVTYQYLSDPAGVPAWIVNLFTVNAPFQALSRLRTAVETH